jgi:hypothetical protein
MEVGANVCEEQRGSGQKMDEVDDFIVQASLQSTL